MYLRRFALAVVFLIAAAAIPVLAQGPMQKRINFSIDAPFELKKGNAVLPAGNYVLFQIVSNDPHLFALYRDDMTHSPVAMIRTTRVDHATRWPQKTRIILETNESSLQNYPMLEGWNIPGENGWEVISVVTRRGALDRYQARSLARSR